MTVATLASVHPLAGRRIIVTRPETPNGPLTAALRDAGAIPITLSLLHIEPVTAPGLPISAPGIAAYDRIMFTSANGVTQFSARLRAEAIAALVAHSGIAVVGPATAAAVAAIGARATIVATDHRAEGLADALGNVAGQRILWPRAEGARPVLAQRLRAAGATVDDHVVYRTIASRGAHEALPDADAVTFTSPSGVGAFIEAFGVPTTTRVACIGPVTADAARARGITVHAVATEYTMDGLVRAVGSLFESSTTHSIR